LSDNFFCHLHSHDHDHDQNDNKSSNQTEPGTLLEPINKYRLLKSILISPTKLILNENHLDLKSISYDKDRNVINCATCDYNLGSRDKKNPNNYILWRWNLLINKMNGEEVNNNDLRLDLIESLEPGRYLFETVSKNLIYIIIFSKNSCHNQFNKPKIEKNNEISIFLTENNRKKIMFSTELATTDQMMFKNDIDIESFDISNEYFEYLAKYLLNSNRSLLPHSLRSTKTNLKFAII
jgi:hypothetical protein